jgi:cytochrome P450
MEKAGLVSRPPGPSSRFPARLLRKFLHDPLQTFTEIATEYGDISYFRLGRQHAYLLNNPDYIEKVLIYDHNNFKKGKRLQAAKRFLGEGLVTSEGERHDGQKKIIQPFFLPRKISSFGPIMTEYTLRMCKGWKDGSTIDIHKEMAKVTLSIICKSMMDYDMEEEEAHEFEKAFSISKEYTKRLQSPIGHVLDSVPVLPKVIESRRAAKTLDSIVYRLMSNRRQEISQDLQDGNSSSNYAKSQKRNDLLTGLLLAEGDIQEQDGKNRLTTAYNSSVTDIEEKEKEKNNNTNSAADKQIRDHVITMLIAGHETTANALTWTYYLLAQHPEIEKKVFDEISLILRKESKQNRNNNNNNNNEDDDNPSDSRYRQATTADIPKLKYLEKVFRESMRLYPPVWTMGRIVENDYMLGDYFIPKESALFMSQYVMHRNPKYYENPEEFNPDRWSNEFKRNIPRFSYFPFGGGLRGCIGEPFAWQEGILLIATISSHWKMSLKPGQKIKLDPGITLNPKNGIKMILQSR